MQFYNETHKYTCGIDLHARNHVLCVRDKEGNTLYHRRILNNKEQLLEALSDYREDVVVSAESTFNWYWLADACHEAGIRFVLGHAQYMKSIHEGKSKNDYLDSEKIARLTAARMLPQAYVYPAQLRGLRDVLRRRLYFTRFRAALKGHIRIVALQHNVSLDAASDKKGRSRRQALLSCFSDKDVREVIDCNLRTITFLSSIISRLEKYAVTRINEVSPEQYKLLCSIPGIGPVLGLTILTEMHTVKRFSRCQNFLSYARLVRSIHFSNGEKVGKGKRKIGNPYLKWAFSEAAVSMTAQSQEVKEEVEMLKDRYGAAGAWSRTSLKIGRTVYYMLKHLKPFDLSRFLQNSKKGVESKANSLEPHKEVAMVID